MTMTVSMKHIIFPNEALMALLKLIVKQTIIKNICTELCYVMHGSTMWPNNFPTEKVIGVIYFI